MNNLCIRVNSTYESGMGHFMRCLALAQKWQEMRGNVYFVVNNNEKIISKVIDENMKYIIYDEEIGTSDDASFLCQNAEKYNASWIVIDGYMFNEDYFDIIKKNNFKSLLFDDDGRLDYYKNDFILNQNLHANPELYLSKKEDYSQLLLGNKFILLRNEFLKYIHYEKDIKTQANNILITLGGSDVNNYSLKVLKSLNNSNFDDLNIIIILGANNIHENSIKQYLKESNLNGKILKNISNMADIMKWADLAFSSGGTTVWELAFMGVPSIIGSVSNVEELLINGLNKHDLFETVGSIENLELDELTDSFNKIINNKNLRTKLSKKGKNFVDGCGSERIINLMEV